MQIVGEKLMNIQIMDFKKIIDLFLLTLLIFSANVALMAPISFYGFNIGLVFLISLVGFLFSKVLEKDSLIVISVIFFLFSPLLLIQATYLYYADAIWVMGIFTILISIVTLLFYSFIKKISFDILLKSIKYSIYIFSLPIIIQFFYVYILGGDPLTVDVATYLGGEYSRSGNTLNATVENIYTYRPTGLTSEPSMSSGVISSLIALYYTANKNANKIVIYAGLLAMILSLSTLGILMSIVMSMVIFINSAMKTFVFLIVSFFSSGFIFFQLGNRYERFLSGDDGSNNIKKEVINYFFSDQMIMLFGYSNPVVSSFNSPIFFQAFGDLGFFLTIIGRYGLVVGAAFLIFFSVWLLKLKFNWKEYILIVIGLLKFATCLAPAFLIYCMILQRINFERNK